MWGYSRGRKPRKTYAPRDRQAGFETDVFHMRIGLPQCDMSLLNTCNWTAVVSMK